MKPNYKAIYWKTKSAEKGAEIKRINKRKKEVTSSRDKWRNKYFSKNKECEKYIKELTAIKKKT